MIIIDIINCIFSIIIFILYSLRNICLIICSIFGNNNIIIHRDNIEEKRLLGEYYDSIIPSTTTLERLRELNPRNIPSYLYYKYRESINKEDFINKCI